MSRWRHLTNQTITAGKQVDTFTITGVGGVSETWTWTLTLDNGDTFTETFVADATPTTAEISVGVAAAISASINPHFAKFTAVAADPDVTVTAATAGIPFSLTLAASGTGTVSKVATIANIGVNDFQFPQNFSNSALPTAEDVIFEAGQTDILYRLNYSGTAISDLIVESGCKSNFGRLEFGKYLYLQLDSDDGFNFRGNGGRCLFDLGANAIAPFIDSTGRPIVQNAPAIFIKGSALTIVEIVKGHVGIAAIEGDTATVATILAGSGKQGNTTLLLGSGLTLSAALTLDSGIATVECNVPTMTIAKGATLSTAAAAQITTRVNVHGLMYANGSGTIVRADVSGILDFSQDRTARTVSLINPLPGGRVLLHSGITVTAWGSMPSVGEFTTEWVD